MPKNIDTCTETIAFCQLSGGPGGRLKQPRLVELYEKLFGKPFEEAHDAAYDVDATAKAFFELLRKKIISSLTEIDPQQISYEAPDLKATNFTWIRKKDNHNTTSVVGSIIDISKPYVHLHGHSQFSVLQATPKVDEIVAKAVAENMPAIALTDLGNMFGTFRFVQAANRADIKAIVGCEFYVAEERLKLQFTRDNPDRRFRQVLIAKNKTGYQNLIKLSSLAYKEGNYGLFPRIDKALIKQYREGLIALSGSTQGEIPYQILNVGETQAEESLLWWKALFGTDFYLELNRHNLEDEDRLNEILVRFSRKHHIKMIAANEYFYLKEEDAKAHDVLICIREDKKQSTPIGRGRGYRSGLPNSAFYFKSQQEIKEAFSDLPEAIENITEIVEKITPYELEREVLLPAFDIPEKFKDPADKTDGGKRGENTYLKHLTYQGAAKRYEEITDEIRERLDFELKTIANTGYPGYFLIVQDLTAKAREMGVSVGPGRGSAAGSVVAYCIGITNIDPIAYDLLFERFLNPDRISLPDIDIDFDDEGRKKIIQYIIDKYGYDQVAQIITYGSMGPKSAIRDAGRVMELPLPETVAISKLIPGGTGVEFSKVFAEVKELRELKKGNGLPSQVLNQAQILEGSLRNTGVHPCGIIITPDEMSNFVPLARSKDSDLMLTQYDHDVVESAGMLKMDLLGLKTLSIIKTAIENIKKRYGKEIDIDTIPLDDQKTYELYQRGETNGTFQFESPGMQKHLRTLKPNRLEDLIAMNALYRPGPMEYIPKFIARKQGKEPINYDIPEMEEYLSETYGITVYQEQVMLLSQKLAGFTKGEADVLRKAMGKKKRDVLDKMKPKFISQASKKGYPQDKLEKIWKDWEAFAEYAFNKSHSTCYSVVAYQTGYLKANYPAEFMAAVLTRNQNEIDKISSFMEECRNLQIKVLGPHINESGKDFIVNKEGEIRYGMGAIKGTGESAIQDVIEERDAHGPFDDVFHFAERVNLRTVNKNSLESLAKAGAFDCFENFHRRQYIEPDEEGTSVIEKAIRYAHRVEQEAASTQVSLFGDSHGASISKPKVGTIEPYGQLQELNIEKEMVGLYISGHPLDQFQFELRHFTSATLGELSKLEKFKNNEICLAGIVSNVQHKVSKNHKPFGQFIIEDFTGTYSFYLFGEDYLKYKGMLETGWFLFLTTHVGKKWKSEEPELKINSIELLSEIRSKRIKSIELLAKLDEVDMVFIDELERIVTKHPGKCNLKLSLEGERKDQALKLSLLSRKYRVDPTNELLKKIENMNKLEYRVDWV